MTPDDSSNRAGSVAFAVVFLLFSLFLLSQIGEETKFSARGKLFAQPRFWPAVGVGGMVIFALIHLLSSWRHRVAGEMAEAFYWIRSLEYLAWFMAYVPAVPFIGYLAATLLFVLLLCLRTGYRQPRQLAIALALGFAIVLVFKAGLSVKIPGGAVYEYLPDALRNFMIINF